jgi:hypothetical protein
MMEEEVCGLRDRGSLITGEEERHLRKMTNNHPNSIMFVESGRNTT